MRTALPGLGRFREASLVLEEGLKIDPFNPGLKIALDRATQGVLSDILEGIACLGLVNLCNQTLQVHRSFQDHPPLLQRSYLYIQSQLLQAPAINNDEIVVFRESVLLK